MVNLQVGSFIYEDVSKIQVGKDDSLVFVCPDEGVLSSVRFEADEWNTVTLSRKEQT